MTSLGDLADPDLLICEQCNKPVPFLEAVIMFGIVCLFGKHDGYFGTVCPACKKTAIRKDDIKVIESLKDSINDIGDDGFGNGILRYYSIPYSYDDFIEKSHYATSSSLVPLPIDQRMLENPEFTIFDDSVDLEGGYRSYVAGNPSIDPMMAIYTYNKESVIDLVIKENESGKRILPRYVFYDELLSSIENFSWKYHFQLEFNHMVEQSFPGSEIIEIGVCPGQKMFDRNSDFLKILQAPAQEPNNAFLPTSVKAALNSVQILSQETQCRGTAQKNNSPETMIHRLWENFNNDRIQESLSYLSKRFIYEYSELSQRIDFSRSDILGLASEYLQQSYDSLASEKKRIIIRNRVPESELQKLKEARKCFPNVNIVTQDSVMNNLLIDIAQIADINDMTIDFLILGEMGTGKELFAKAIHEASRRKGQFVRFNSANLSENLIESVLFGHEKWSFTDAKTDKIGFFEQAEGGSIFFDEIGELPITLQPRLLRVIQEREIQILGATLPKKIDVKIIFATNKNIEEMVKSGTFREDLYERIKTFKFMIPPLRERKNDIPFLVGHFIKQFDKQRELNLELTPIKVSDICMDTLFDYDWPGNVRELENVFKRIFALRRKSDKRDEILPYELPPQFFQNRSKNQEEISIKSNLKPRQKVSDQQISICMKKNNNNKAQVARELDVSYKTIQRRWMIIESNPTYN